MPQLDFFSYFFYIVHFFSFFYFLHFFLVLIIFPYFWKIYFFREMKKNINNIYCYVLILKLFFLIKYEQQLVNLVVKKNLISLNKFSKNIIYLINLFFFNYYIKFNFFKNTILKIIINNFRFKYENNFIFISSKEYINFLKNLYFYFIINKDNSLKSKIMFKFYWMMRYSLKILTKKDISNLNNFQELFFFNKLKKEFKLIKNFNIIQYFYFLLNYYLRILMTSLIYTVQLNNNI